MVKVFFEISWFCWIHPMFLEKIKFCLWKLELEFWTNGLISPLPKDLEPNCPKLGFRFQTPNVIALGSQSFFVSIFYKILHQISPYFQVLGHFWQSYECLSSENCKKAFFLVSFEICKFPLKSLLKKFLFLSTKSEISRESLGQIQKISPFWNPHIKGFQMIWK